MQQGVAGGSGSAGVDTRGGSHAAVEPASAPFVGSGDALAGVRAPHRDSTAPPQPGQTHSVQTEHSLQIAQSVQTAQSIQTAQSVQTAYSRQTAQSVPAQHLQAMQSVQTPQPLMPYPSPVPAHSHGSSDAQGRFQPAASTPSQLAEWPRTVDAIGVGPTMVIPKAGSRTARRTRPLRAWMLALPVDFGMAVAPAPWFAHQWRGIVSMAALTVVLFAVGGHYRGRRHMSFLDEFPSLTGRLLAAAAAVAAIASQRHDTIEIVGPFMRSFAVSAGLVLFGRLLTRKIVLVARQRRLVCHGVLIVGHGPVAAELARLLQRYPQYGLRFAGFVDDERPQRGNGQEAWAGTLDQLDDLIVKTETDVVIIADTTTDESRLMEIVRRPQSMTCDLLVVPRLHDFHTQVGTPDHVGGIPIMRIRRPTLTGPKWALKRTSDILFAVVALVVLSPVLLICAIAVFLEGGRGIFFRQERVGRFGGPFNLIKFRSMRPRDANDSATTWSVAHDPRVGPVGRFLRRTSLDELPQLWNILRGDMTLVGPRPERPYFVEKFSAEHAHYVHRHRVPSGLTGLAQVSGLRGDTPISDRARFDNYYIENWSLWLDAKVIVRTVAEVFRGGGR
jgi:exopolysaccharide biosynthesis polyprenyl glycosylphosphotransferase